jgi:hypothetical protein
LNPTENLGILNSNVMLTLESKKSINASDTISLCIKNLRRTNYQFKLSPKFFDENITTISLHDRFTNQAYVLSKNDTSSYLFTVNTAAATYDSLRFYIVLNAKKRIQPVTFAPSEQDQNEIIKNKLQPKMSTQSINVYPNPVSGNKVTLSVQNFVAGDYYLEIKNILGVVVNKMNLTVLSDIENFKIELPKHTAKGVYYLQITNGLMEERIQIVVN